MRKRKSTRETKNMIQTALWLPRDMHEKLKEDGGERGLGDEIRRRLQLTFVAEQQSGDPITDLLLNLIRQIDRKLSLDVSWSEDSIGFDVLRLAINKLLSDLILNIHPTSESRQATMAKLQARYGPDAKPETIAEILARTVLVEHATEQFRPRAADNQER